MEHYFSPGQSSPSREREFTCILSGRSFTFVSAAGTFAKYRVDPATRLLIESVSFPPDVRILDLGCGIGIIGIAMARLFGAEVIMTEVNERAARLAGQNAKLNRVKARVLAGDLYAPVPGKFDAILVNPPMAAGRETCYRIIDEAPAHLCEGGRLVLVARHAKGGAMLSRRMQERFGNCETLASKGGFRVYCATV